jgi:uncharacterized membrane protein YbhN (UPF0104 family)
MSAAPLAVLAFDSYVDRVFSTLTGLRWDLLALGLALQAANLTLRSRAAFNIVSAAYPGANFGWKRIWGAYVAGHGANSFLPAHGGDALRLFLVRRSVPGSSYPTIAATFLVENIFDFVISLLVVAFAMSQGVMPGPPDLSTLGPLQPSRVAADPIVGPLLVMLSAIVLLAGFARLAGPVRRAGARVREGFAVVHDGHRYLRHVVAWQLAAWLCRAGCSWCLLEAFGIDASIRSVLLIFGVLAVSSIIPFLPSGAGVQQMLLVEVFAGQASPGTVAAYSVGQQLALTSLTVAVGLCAVMFIFRMRSFGDALRRGRAARCAAPEPAGVSGQSRT